MKSIRIISKLNVGEFGKRLSENLFSSFYSAPRRNVLFLGNVKDKEFDLKSVGQEFFRLHGKVMTETEEGTIVEITYIYLWQYNAIKYMMLISIIAVVLFAVFRRLFVGGIIVFVLGCFGMFGVEMCKSQAVSELLNITDSHFL